MADRRVGVPRSSHGGKFKSGQPRFICIHCLQAPAKDGMAYSLATGWMQNAGTSVHTITDPGESVDLVPIDTVAYHCGSGNPFSLGNEITGYAEWTFEQWTTGKAFDAVRLAAKKGAARAKELNIPLRWLSIAQMRDGSSKGFCTHNDMRLAFGGTTHTDPGPNFPYAIFMKMVQQYSGEAIEPVSPPITPPAGPGGAEGIEEEDMFFMYAPKRPVVVVVDGKGSDLVGLDYSEALKGLRSAGVKEYNMGTDAAFDAAMRAVVSK